MSRNNLFEELKRRNVYKVAVAYVVVSWLLIQAASILLPTFDAPASAMKILVALLVVGFPIALGFSWAFEITPEGIKKESEVPPEQSIASHTGRRLVGLTIVLAVIAAALLAFQMLRPRIQTVGEAASFPPKQDGKLTASPTIAGTTQASTVSEKSIAVLPFDNLSHDPDNAYFVEGIQDEILTRLAKIGALKVISRTSTQKYKSTPDNLRDVGKQLGAANLVEGSVQKIANAVHVNVQLIRAATDEHLWAESYNRKLDDVFGVEGEVATAIAEQLNTRLSGAEEKAVKDKPTENTAAYDAYLRGLVIEQSRTDDAGQDAAVASYAAAVRLDPNFALAWARLALIRSNFYFGGVNLAENSAAAVKEAAERAISLQPELGEAFIAQGAYRYRVLRDFQGALESYGEAVKRLPNNSLVLENMALVERRVGRWDIAEKHFRAAVDLDPRNVDSLSTLAEFLAVIRKSSEAQDTYDRVLQIVPNDEVTLANKAGLYQRDGRLPEAAQELKKTSAHSLNIGVDIIKALQCSYERHFEEAIATLKSSAAPGILADARTMIVIGFWQQYLGRNDEARENINRGIKAIQPAPDATIPVDSRTLRSFLAFGYALLGEKDQALTEAHASVNDYRNDLVNRPNAEMFLAMIQARLGDADSAIAALSHLLEVQNGVSVGGLRIDPFWDPLRKDPRFQKLVEQTETK